MSEREELLQCILEAMPHVYRQQGHGKHEQDRADAEAWWAKWKAIRRSFFIEKSKSKRLSKSLQQSLPLPIRNAQPK
tara:strand:+ start:268 stop:498 length:231 start_codon:yes stop_codon:yes gene_type:complete